LNILEDFPWQRKIIFIRRRWRKLRGKPLSMMNEKLKGGEDLRRIIEGIDWEFNCEHYMAYRFLGCMNRDLYHFM